MVRFTWSTCIIIAAIDALVLAQIPQRLQIPGAVLLQSQEPLARPVVYRPQTRVQQSLLETPRTRYFTNSSPRVRSRPPALQAPANTIPIRPVVEEQEEDYPPQPVRTSFLDDEVARLGLNALQSAVQQADEEDERPLPVRPIPILRQDIREQPQLRPISRQQQTEITRPAPILRPIERPVIRQELKQEQLYQTRPAPIQRQQEVERDEPLPVPVRRPQQQVRVQQQQQQPIRQQQTHVRAPAPRPAPQYLRDADDDSRIRGRKPPIKILRKYRTENEDGSITWGYESEDGSFKEELIGIDCITRGKYGYVDPDGVRREYSYETGAKCDEPEEQELEDLPPGRQPLPPQKGGAVKRPAAALRPVGGVQYQ